MVRPIKKLSVTLEVRRKWLQRHEENGEPVPQIAKRDGYDVRTVRKQLDMARQERETRETRLIVLRDAMQSHYSDLCKCVEQIDSSLRGGHSFDLVTADRMCKALHQHLPRAPLWKYLEKWNDIHRNLAQTTADLITKYTEYLTQDPQLRGALSKEKIDISSMVEFFVKQTKFWAQGGPGVDIKQAFRTEPDSQGLVNLRLGGYNIGTVVESRAAEVRESLLNFRKRLSGFAEYQVMAQRLKELKELEPDIQEELAIITLRRVVPGRCKYCPV